jgi:hypothetical protein
VSEPKASPLKTLSSPESECEDDRDEGNAETFMPSRRPVFAVKYWVKAAEKFPVVSEDEMLQKSINESSEPAASIHLHSE